MPSEPLHVFDPRRNFQLQGFTGRAATTTIHHATATGVAISGIFQAAEDFAVLGFWNVYDYFNHLRVKHLPRTDLLRANLWGVMNSYTHGGLSQLSRRRQGRTLIPSYSDGERSEVLKHVTNTLLIHALFLGSLPSSPVDRTAVNALMRESETAFT